MHQFWAIFSFNNYTWHPKKVLDKIFSKFFQPFDSLSQLVISINRTARFLFCVVNFKLAQGLSGTSRCIVMFYRQTFQLKKRSYTKRRETIRNSLPGTLYCCFRKRNSLPGRLYCCLSKRLPLA